VFPNLPKSVVTECRRDRTLIARRASKATPCPVCGGDHSCSITEDGLHFCWRAHWPVAGWRHLGESTTGFGLFRPDGEGVTVVSDGRSTRFSSPRRGENDHWLRRTAAWLPEAARRFAANAADVLDLLARQLGVTTTSLKAIGVGYLPVREFDPPSARPYWSFPEKDTVGRVIGIKRRDLCDGTKDYLKGSRPGLVYAANWPDYPGPILLPEGASDVAALLTLGLCAVGRPSNLGGVELLAELLANTDRGREIVVIGENDRHRSKTGLEVWPGRDGAAHTAARLSELLGRPVWWSLVPNGAKDTRAWLNAAGCDLTEASRLRVLGESFVEALLFGANRSRSFAAAVRGGDGAALVSAHDLSDFDANTIRRLAAEIIDERRQRVAVADRSKTTAGLPEHRCLNVQRIFQARKDRRGARVIGCRCRRCVGCLAWKKHRYKESLAAHVRAEPESAVFCVFEVARWNSDLHGRPFAGRWARVARPDGSCLIVAAGTAPRWAGGNARLVKHEEAILALREAIETHSGEGSFVKTGRRWGLSAESSQSSGEWEQGKRLPPTTTEAVVREIAEPNGVQVERRNVPVTQANRWLSLLYLKFPSGWSEDRIADFYAQLRLGEYLPPWEEPETKDEDSSSTAFRVLL